MSAERLFILFICLILTVVMLINYISCECGRPHKPSHGSHSRRHTQRFREDSVINYFCNASYRLVHDSKRVCKHGIWSGKPPICAKSINSGISLERVLIFSEIIQEYNTSDSLDDQFYAWKAIDGNCISSHSLKPQNWTFLLNKAVIINFFTLKLQTNITLNNTILANVKAFVNKHRTCSFLKFNVETIELEFICDSLSGLKSKLEERDKRNRINLYFDLLFSATLTVCGLGLYRFPRDCGKIGVPLQTNIDDIEEGHELEASCEDGYELVGSERVYCGSDGQWIGNPMCKPLVTCPLIIPIQKYDNNVVRIEYKNGFYFNRTLMAVNETNAVHYCTKTNITSNNTFSRHLIKYYRVCENGIWSEVETDCDTLLIDDGLIDRSDNKSSNSLVLITMSAIFLFFCLLCALTYYVFKRKNKRRKKKTQQISDEQSVNKLDQSNGNSSRYSSNRISDPFDDSVYSLVAEEKYEIIKFDTNQSDFTEQYDDVETSAPIYLEIIPLNNVYRKPTNSNS
jgi:hypothetical protein